jgi:transposase
MRFVGIDVGSEQHTIAIVDEHGEPLLKPQSFAEDADGYRRVREVLGDPTGCLVAMEATGHYWKNLFASLTGNGFAIALLNPIRTRRFAEEELQRTKTDHVDALGIARFAAQKRPKPTQLPDERRTSYVSLSICANRLSNILVIAYVISIERLI